MKNLSKIYALIVLLLCSFTILAETKLKGKVTDGKEPIIGANISIKGTTEGTVTDIDGAFELATSQPTPLTLVISMVGMATTELKVDGSKEDIAVTMAEETSLLTDVVVAASRVEEKIIELQANKKSLSDSIISTEENAFSTLSKDEILALFK